MQLPVQYHVAKKITVTLKRRGKKYDQLYTYKEYLWFAHYDTCIDNIYVLFAYISSLVTFLYFGVSQQV